MIVTNTFLVIIILSKLASVSCDNCEFSPEERNQCHKNTDRLRSLCNEKERCHASKDEMCRCQPCSDLCRKDNETDCQRYCPKFYKGLKQTTLTPMQTTVGKENAGSSIVPYFVIAGLSLIIIVLIIILIVITRRSKKGDVNLEKKVQEQSRIIDRLKNDLRENESSKLIPFQDQV